MARAWAFYPHPGGRKIRGLDLQGGTISWAACRTNDTRRETIFLPGPADATLDVEDSSVVQVSYGSTPIQGLYPIHVKSVGPGTSYIEAYRGDTDYTWMYVTVFPQLTMQLSFKRVETEAWKSNLSIGKMQRLVENLNYIYSYQGNISFTAISTPKKVTIPGLANVVPTNIVRTWSQYRDSGADATVFFVKETSALAVNWSDLVIMEDSQTRPWDEMTCAHELGHRMNLRHPAPSIAFNLMNQTGVGDRDRMKIYLTRTQIETITSKSNWKQIQSSGTTDADTCEMPR